MKFPHIKEDYTIEDRDHMANAIRENTQTKRNFWAILEGIVIAVGVIAAIIMTIKMMLP